MPENKAINLKTINFSAKIIYTQPECAKINSAIIRPCIFKVSLIKRCQKCLIFSIFTIMCIFMIFSVSSVGEIYP